MIRRTLDSAFRAVDPIRLDLFGRAFAFSFLLYMVARFAYGYEWLTAWGFHTTAETKLAPYLDPWPLLPPWALAPVALVVAAACLSMMAGRRPRLAATFLWAWSTYIQLADRPSSFTLNKLYVVFFALLALAPAIKEYAIPGGGVVRRQSAWPLRVVQATIVIQYFTAGTCKICCGGDWLEHTDVLWSQSQGVFCTDFAAFLLRNLPRSAWVFMGYSSLAFELLSPVLLLVRPLRAIGIAWGLVFLTLITLTMEDLIYFTLQLAAFFVAFVDERRLISIKTWIVRRFRGTIDGPAGPSLRPAVREESNDVENS